MEVRFVGQVQGVGFRYTVASISKSLEVVGYVQNRADGSVLLVAEGTDAELSRFVNEIAGRMAGHIDDFVRVDSAATGEFGAFEIRY